MPNWGRIAIKVILLLTISYGVGYLIGNVFSTIF